MKKSLIIHRDGAWHRRIIHRRTPVRAQERSRWEVEKLGGSGGASQLSAGSASRQQDSAAWKRRGCGSSKRRDHKVDAGDGSLRGVIQFARVVEVEPGCAAGDQHMIAVGKQRRRISAFAGTRHSKSPPVGKRIRGRGQVEGVGVWVEEFDAAHARESAGDHYGPIRYQDALLPICRIDHASGRRIGRKGRARTCSRIGRGEGLGSRIEDFGIRQPGIEMNAPAEEQYLSIFEQHRSMERARFVHWRRDRSERVGGWIEQLGSAAAGRKTAAVATRDKDLAAVRAHNGGVQKSRGEEGTRRRHRVGGRSERSGCRIVEHRSVLRIAGRIETAGDQNHSVVGARGSSVDQYGLMIEETAAERAFGCTE